MATLSAVSAVIGSRLAVPRMPSVPKRFRVINPTHGSWISDHSRNRRVKRTRTAYHVGSGRPSMIACRTRHGLACGGDVVDAQDAGRPDRAPAGRPRATRHTAFRRRLPRLMRPMKPLRETPTRTAQPRPCEQRVSRSRISRLCATVLPKPMPGSSRDPVERDPGRTAGSHPFGEIIEHLGRRIAVGRVLLHGPRLSLHVHQDDAAPCCRPRQPGSPASPVRAVTSLTMRAPASSAAAMIAACAGVDRDRGARPARARTTGTTRRNSSSAETGAARRAGQFTADVEDVRPVGLQRQAMRDGRGVIAELAAVGEAVRRDVDDAHDRGRTRSSPAKRRGEQRSASVSCAKATASARVTVSMSASGPPRRIIRTAVNETPPAKGQCLPDHHLACARPGQETGRLQIAPVDSVAAVREPSP